MELIALDEESLVDLDHASIANFITNPIIGNSIENRIKFESEIEEFVFMFFIQMVYYCRSSWSNHTL